MYLLFQFGTDGQLHFTTDEVDPNAPDFRQRLETTNETLWFHFPVVEEADASILRERFGFHEIAVEDCIHDHIRPKVNLFDKILFVCLQYLEFDHSEHAVQRYDLRIFVNQRYVVTVGSEPEDLPQAIAERLQHNPMPENVRGDGVLHAILDLIVDTHHEVLEAFEEEIDAIEEDLFETDHDEELLARMLGMKRQVLNAHRMLVPQEEVTRQLTEASVPGISKEMRPFFQDCYEHMSRLTGLVSAQREVLVATMNAHLSLASLRLNEVMKILTVIATITMPLAVIVGVYGMNFENMPELRTRYGYYGVLGVMAAITLVMIRHFKKKGWL